MANLGPDQERPETGYAMTQLLPRQGEDALVLGFDRHDRFQHSFQFNTRSCPPSLMIQTLWDQKDQPGLSRCVSERLVILEGEKVEKGLKEWACLLAETSPLPPRHSAPITGWSSWYNLYTSISDEIILEHLHNTKSVMTMGLLPKWVTGSRSSRSSHAA
jgi:hypothetical protein